MAEDITRCDSLTSFDLLNDLGSNVVTSIQRFNTETGAFETATFGPNGQPVGVNFPMVPGEGYFVFAK